MSSASRATTTPTLPTVTTGGRVPILSWASPLEASAEEQARNLANLPFAIDHVALMPDAHTGYGMPIGGVLFADGAVVPYAIGVDIGCGVALVETDFTVDRLDRTTLDRTLGEIASRVPTGTSGQSRRVDRDAALAQIRLPVPESVDSAWFERSVDQLGTLGGGNHFLEVQRDDDGRVFVMLHSGSRSLGKQICDAFHQRALAANRRDGDPLPHHELAYLRDGTPDFAGYWAAMTFALRFAEVNRARMLDQTEFAFGLHTGIGRFSRTVEVHHNFAAWETHLGRSGIVHRKGAVRANAGETVLIPGSMGTASWVAEGLGNPAAFSTCQHGAGRQMSRTASRKAMTSAQLFDQMSGLGVLLHSGAPKTAAEEAPGAEPLTARAREAAHIGEERGIPLLTTPSIDLDGIGDVHFLALAVAGLLDADAYYRCPHDAGEVIVLLDVPAIRAPIEHPELRAMTVVPQSAFVPGLLSAPAIAGCLRWLGLPVTETESEVRIGDGTMGTFTFDALGRLTGMTGTVPAPPA